MATGFELGSILQNAVNLTNEQTRLASQEVAYSEKAMDAAAGQATQINQAALLQSQVTSAQGQLVLQAEQQNRRVAELAGTQIGGPSDVLGPLLQSMQQDAGKLVQAQGVVSQLESNSDLLTNPLGFIRNLVQGDGARAQRDAIADSLNVKTQTAQALNTATQQSVMTQESIKQTTTQATIVDMAQMDILKGQIQATEATKEAYRYGAQAVGIMRQLGVENFNRATNMYQLLSEESRYQEGLELRKEQLAHARMSRKGAQDELKYYDEATARINAFRERASLPPMQVHQVRMQLNQNSKLGENLREQEYRGYILADMGDAGPLYGNSPSESINLLQNSGAGLPKQYEEMAGAVISGAVTKLDTVVAAEALKAQNPALAKDKQFRDRVLDQIVKQEAKTLTADVQPGKGNPYELPKLNTLLSSMPEVGETEFGKKILAPLAASGQQDINPEQLLALASDAIGRNEISINDARDGYIKLFSSGVGLRNASGGFLAMSVPTTVGYTARVSAFQPGFIERNSFFLSVPNAMLNPSPESAARLISSQAGGSGREMKPLDHTNPEDVTLALTVMTSKKKAASILEKYNQARQ